MFAALSLLLTLVSSSLVHCQNSDGMDTVNAMVDLMASVLDILNVNLDVDLNLGGVGCGVEDYVNCYRVETIDRNLNDNFCEQPLFVKFLTKNERSCLIDNICYTYFPLPDDPYTFNQYKSTVFMDGSFLIETSVVTDIELGRTRSANPFCTSVYNYLGYAGCDTFVIYRCNEFGAVLKPLRTGSLDDTELKPIVLDDYAPDCACNNEVSVQGLSVSPLPLGIACIEMVKNIMECSGIGVPDIVLLPQALPPKCVTEQLCINSIQGNFFRALNLPAPAIAPVVLV